MRYWVAYEFGDGNLRASGAVIRVLPPGEVVPHCKGLGMPIMESGQAEAVLSRSGRGREGFKGGEGTLCRLRGDGRGLPAGRAACPWETLAVGRGRGQIWPVLVKTTQASAKILDQKFAAKGRKGGKAPLVIGEGVRGGGGEVPAGKAD